MTEVLDATDCAVQVALDDLDGALDRLHGVDLWGVGSDELIRVTGELQRLLRRTEAMTVKVVGEVDLRGAAVARGATSTAAWLRWAHRLHPGAAKRLVDTAKSVHAHPGGPLVPTEDVTAPHALLRGEFADGLVSGEPVQVVTGVLDALPAGVDAATRADAETTLVGLARQHDPKALTQIGKHLRHVLERDGEDTLGEEEERARASRRLDIRPRGDGSSELSGHLDPELTALLLSQLGPLAAPRPAGDGGRDPRSPGQRNADALADLLAIVAASDRVPTRHGTRPTVAVHLSLETLQRRLGAAAATLDWSGPICAESARRLACDAKIIPVVLAANGEPLDVGRASYSVTQPIWRALVARDGGCSFAGCDRPPEWTEAHHIIHWADHGETSVENTCLLCDHHHRVVHHHGWDIELTAGVIHVRPPPWIDPDRTPRRNTQRAQLAALLNTPEPPDLDCR